MPWKDPEVRKWHRRNWQRKRRGVRVEPEEEWERGYKGHAEESNVTRRTRLDKQKKYKRLKDEQYDGDGTGIGTMPFDPKFLGFGKPKSKRYFITWYDDVMTSVPNFDLCGYGKVNAMFAKQLMVFGTAEDITICRNCEKEFGPADYLKSWMWKTTALESPYMPESLRNLSGSNGVCQSCVGACFSKRARKYLGVEDYMDACAVESDSIIEQRDAKDYDSRIKKPMVELQTDVSIPSSNVDQSRFTKIDLSLMRYTKEELEEMKNV